MANFKDGHFALADIVDLIYIEKNSVIAQELSDENSELTKLAKAKEDAIRAYNSGLKAARASKEEKARERANKLAAIKALTNGDDSLLDEMTTLFFVAQGFVSLYFRLIFCNTFPRYQL